MSCGLRPIQSAKTMTWFSDKSGIASTGVCNVAYSPPTATPSQMRITSQRFRTLNSMTLAIIFDAPVGASVLVPRRRRYSGRRRSVHSRRIEPILGIHQERSYRHDAVTLIQPVQHRVVIPGRRPELDRRHVEYP